MLKKDLQNSGAYYEEEGDGSDGSGGGGGGSGSTYSKIQNRSAYEIS